MGIDRPVFGTMLSRRLAKSNHVCTLYCSHHSLDTFGADFLFFCSESLPKCYLISERFPIANDAFLDNIIHINIFSAEWNWHFQWTNDKGNSTLKTKKTNKTPREDRTDTLRVLRWSVGTYIPAWTLSRMGAVARVLRWLFKLGNEKSDSSTQAMKFLRMKLFKRICIWTWKDFKWSLNFVHKVVSSYGKVFEVTLCFIGAQIFVKLHLWKRQGSKVFPQ